MDEIRPSQPLQHLTQIPFKYHLKGCHVITFSATLTPNIELYVHIFCAPLPFMYLPKQLKTIFIIWNMPIQRPKYFNLFGIPVWFRVPYDVTIKLVRSSWVNLSNKLSTAMELWIGIIRRCHSMCYNRQEAHALLFNVFGDWAPIPLNWRHSKMAYSDRRRKNSLFHSLSRSCSFLPLFGRCHLALLTHVLRFPRQRYHLGLRNFLEVQLDIVVCLWDCKFILQF